MNPVQTKPTALSIFSQGYKHTAKTLMLQHMAMAGGSIWDEELQKFAAYRDLSKHPNTATRQRWTTSVENEFGHLFQGFLETKGLNVLEWITHDEVPQGKTITYPRKTVDI